MEGSTGTIMETSNDAVGIPVASETAPETTTGLTTHRRTRKVGNGGTKGAPVNFTVVKRKELPLNLILTGRFGKVLAAASVLGPDDAIMLAKGAKQQDLNAMRTTVQDYIEKYPQMRGLKVAQANRTLFIYRP